MFKYNVAICCLPDTDTSLLDYLSDSYDVRMLSYSTINNYDCYNYIITSDDILWFLSEMTEDFVILYVKDDINYILNMNKKRKKKITIYGNKIIESSNKYDFISNLSAIEKDILSVCRDIEYFYHFKD
jgi:hypothetical protein